MITGETIKKLREQYGLTQMQLGRAIFVEESTISNYESGRRNLKINTLESIAKVFGYTVDFNLVKKQESNINYQFYKDKNWEEIMNMDKKDLTEYIFITQDNKIIARICNLNEGIIESLGLSSVKDILYNSVNSTDNSILYYKIKGLHEEVELEVSILIEDIGQYLDENENIPEEILKDVYYIDLDLYKDEDGNYQADHMRLLDKNKNDLNIKHEYIMNFGEIPLFSQAQTYELMFYIEENPILQLKY